MEVKMRCPEKMNAAGNETTPSSPLEREVRPSQEGQYFPSPNPSQEGQLTPPLFTILFLSVLALALVFTQGTPNTSNALTYDKIPLAKISGDNPFTDIGSSIHADNIIWAYQYGITKGSPEGSNTYRPLNAVNRGAMSSFMRRVIGNPEQEKPAPTFTDIQGSMHKDNINWLASEGITKGSPEGSNTYRPLNAVNRGAMATFMYRLAGSPKYTAAKSSFTDVDKSNIHYESINWLKNVGLTTGSPANSDTYKPFDTVNRSSMATFLHRLYTYLLKDKNVEGKCSISKYVNKDACISGGGSWTPTPGPAPTPTPKPTPTPTPTPKPKTYTVTFEGNGSDSGSEPNETKCTTTVKSTCSVTLALNRYNKSGLYAFNGWKDKDSKTMYKDGQTNVTLANDLTLEAQWIGIPSQTMDVYPTTGWENKSIEIYNYNGLFTDVNNVTIGSTECSSYAKKDANTITCTLPKKGELSSNAVLVNVDGTDVYAGRVTYFNPSRKETIGNTTTPHVTFDTFTKADCDTMTPGSFGDPAPANQGQVVNLTDTRNNQTYKVKKMQDGKCWMIDSLKYRGEANPGGIGDIALNNSTENPLSSKVYNNPTLGKMESGDRHCLIDDGMMPTGGTLTGCGYLYNWYAATNGATIESGTAPDSICPTNNTKFKLPRGGETEADNDFAVLNGNMYDGGGASAGNYYLNWLRDGAWQGPYSGYWYTSLYSQGSSSYFWSSTARTATNAYSLVSVFALVLPAIYSSYDSYGFAVRCVL
jgi:hypothetical protein